MKSVLFDSSVWIASFSEKDVNHFIAKRLIKSYAVRKYIIHIPIIVVIEVINVAHRQKLSINIVENFLREVSTLQPFKVGSMQEEILVNIIRKLAPRLNLKSLDLIIISYCIGLNVDEFVTFDNKQKKCYLRAK